LRKYDEEAFEALRSALTAKSRNIRLRAFEIWASLRYPAEPEKRQSFAFFQPISPEQVALAERLVNELPENTDGDPNDSGAG
jgi:hypothetical protein